MFKELKPTTDEEWLEMRRSVITATEMGVILGLNRWKSVRELIESKENPEKIDNGYIWLGQNLEPVVVSAVNKAMHKTFKLFENGSRSFFVDKGLKLGATPDAGTSRALLECKTTKPANYYRWAGWPPAYYLAQLYTQLLCTGRKIGYLGILSTNLTQQSAKLKLPLHVHKLNRTDELDNIFKETVSAFWADYEKGKVYRVNRKRALMVELLLRCQCKCVYVK